MKTRVGSKAFWIAAALFAVFAAFWGSMELIGFKQRRDKAAVRAYIDRVQPLLLADTRFKYVRLLGYSCDSVWSPYMPISGTVPSQADWDALQYLIQTSRPPVFASVAVVVVDSNNKGPKTP
ncbi:MAG TPA: hypothetical protein VGO67_03905 [Verrucomicrobiae bacterium]|jgi:hypothetical protein